MLKNALLSVSESNLLVIGAVFPDQYRVVGRLHNSGVFENLRSGMSHCVPTASEFCWVGLIVKSANARSLNRTDC